MAVDYGMQVGFNYLNGHTGWDAWVGQVDFFDVALSGVTAGVTGGIPMSDKSKYIIEWGELVLSSAIDITGEGHQSKSGSEFFGELALSAAIKGITDAKPYEENPSLKQNVDHPLDTDIEDQNVSRNSLEEVTKSGQKNYVDHSFTLEYSEPINSYYLPEGKTITFERPEIKGYNTITRQKDLYHNFPQEFDAKIIQNGYWSNRLKDMYKYNNIGDFFVSPGIIDGKRGFFTIGINEKGIIFHRCFINRKILLITF